MPGQVQHVSGAPLFDDFTLLHDDHPVTQMVDQRQVMADEHQAQPHIGLQVGEQVEDLALHGDVERRNRLVGDQQAGPGDDGAGNGNALALPAGKLVRVFFRVGGPYAHLVEHRQHALPPRSRRDGPVGEQGLGNAPAHRAPGVERAEGVLKHDLELRPQCLQRGT